MLLTVLLCGSGCKIDPHIYLKKHDSLNSPQDMKDAKQVWNYLFVWVFCFGGVGVLLFDWVFCVSFYFWDGVLLVGRPETHYVPQAGLKLTVRLLPQPPQAWDNGCAPPPHTKQFVNVRMATFRTCQWVGIVTKEAMHTSSTDMIFIRPSLKTGSDISRPPKKNFSVPSVLQIESSLHHVSL